jgi:membrane fusion protein, multidrug efflux system
MQQINQNILIVSVLSIFIACGGNDGKDNKSTAPKNILPVEAYKVTLLPFNDKLITTASVLPNEQVSLMALVAGQVMDIYFKEGGEVKKGETVIRIDDRQWKAQVAGTKAELDAAEKDYKRKKELLSIEGSSQEEVDKAFATIQTLKSQLQQLQINIDLANVSAPFSGQLGMRNFSKGAFLKQGEIITTLTDINPLKIDFNLAEANIKSVEIGKAVTVFIGTDTLEAIIYAINPLIDKLTGAFNVRALLQQSSTRTILPGTFAEVLVTTNFVKDALLIPTQAVVPTLNEQTVYVYKNGKAVRKTIKMGTRNADKIHILEGISVGDTLITTGLLQIKDGMDIQLQAVK